MNFKELFIEKYNYLNANAEIFSNTILNEKELDALEKVFLSDKPLDEIKEYYFLEFQKNDTEFNKRYKEGLKLNNNKYELLELLSNSKIERNEMLVLCSKIFYYIDREEDKEFMLKKQDVINEFARVAKNNYISGVEDDMSKCGININRYISSNKKKARNTKSIDNNNFIEYFSNDHYYNYDFDMRLYGLVDKHWIINEDKMYHLTNEEIRLIHNNKVLKKGL